MQNRHLITIKEASQWAKNYLNRDISESNISYLIQYGQLKKYNENGLILVDIQDLKKYYQSYHGDRETIWKKKLGKDLNWNLSFDYLREKDTTKHVHRLHPYKGKFIPQLVQYFIDNHVDNFKKEVYFKPGDVILDPFSGSGTTLVQSNEMGMHSIGVDISEFNCMITNVKLYKYNLDSLNQDIIKIKRYLTNFENDNRLSNFESELLEQLGVFNSKHFPSPDFKYQVRQGEIDEKKYSEEKEQEFFKIYNSLLDKYGVEFKQGQTNTFLDKWYCHSMKDEINFAYSLIKEIKDMKNKEVLEVILSRTIRSCRATTHYDLATLKKPQLTIYYCWKHKKICKPLYSIKYWFNRYADDTLKRLCEFARLRTSAHFLSLPADSRTVDIITEVKQRDKNFHEILQKQKIQGIFTSPPYVGQIDYHEQHAYAYDLLGYKRNDEMEIGPLYKGQGEKARTSYIEGISTVLLNCKKYLAKDFDIFLVANDKYDLYPSIVELAGMQIIDKFKRPVLNRTERDKTPYSEIIFHIKKR